MGSQHGVKVKPRRKRQGTQGRQAAGKSTGKQQVINMVQDLKRAGGGNDVDRTPGSGSWSKQGTGGGGPRVQSGQKQIPGMDGYVGCWICGNKGHRKDVCGARWQQKTAVMACRMATANGGEWVEAKLKKMARQFGGRKTKNGGQDENDENEKSEVEGLREKLAQERQEKEEWKKKAREME